ncbi:hypothetical protein QBC38DRAFT_398364 [Podospora fimiseda]|uniref:Uncharacterized protein n=1 Tax=Podospora fimiseda TaxID=252190 RepID=A0AAN7GPR5_9PEZI|nr:hypothetical protein QBC38DRAFT_398364 [Podospora fimiseda]
MKFTSILTTTAALVGSAIATPIEAGNGNLVRRQHATSAQFTGFTASCGASSCSYSTTATILPENIVVTLSHTTSGPTIPANSGPWTSSDPQVRLRFTLAFGEYRIVLSDTHQDTAITLDYFSPASDWPGATSYTGPSSFVAS